MSRSFHENAEKSGEKNIIKSAAKNVEKKDIKSAQIPLRKTVFGWIRDLSRGGKIALIIMIPTIILAAYIMIHSLGLSPDLDFGAGAYYYADMPNFQRWTNGNAYHSPVPMWALILLFLAWGWVMWKFWVWIDRKNR